MSTPTDDDRISDLPDSILCHLLSFVPTELAITTSVLSKRWTPLWRSVVALNFDDRCPRFNGFGGFSRFCRFVDSVIDSRDPTLPLQSFRFKCCYDFGFDPSYVNRFVHTALQQGGVENVNLNVSSNPRFPGYLSKKREHLEDLTPSIFNVLTCGTLVVLKLKNLKIYHLPEQVHLPLLKALHLVNIYFMTHYDDFKRLLYGCPILENLQTDSLHSPYLSHYSDVEDYEAFPKLVRAELSNCMQYFTFTWLHNAKFLRAELLSSYDYQVPTFHNLTRMELIFKTSFRKYLWPDKWKWVIQVLEYCPQLQNLTIDEASEDIPLPEDKDWEDPYTIPTCLSSQLKTCLLRGYNDVECELQFARYIILNSKLLHTMTIKSSSLVDDKAKHQMLVRLSSYSRGSATCKLFVY